MPCRTSSGEHWAVWNSGEGGRGAGGLYWAILYDFVVQQTVSYCISILVHVSCNIRLYLRGRGLEASWFSDLQAFGVRPVLRSIQGVMPRFNIFRSVCCVSDVVLHIFVVHNYVLGEDRLCHLVLWFRLWCGGCDRVYEPTNPCRAEVFQTAHTP